MNDIIGDLSALVSHRGHIPSTKETRGSEQASCHGEQSEETSSRKDQGDNGA